jgi:hypothetical protein
MTTNRNPVQQTPSEYDDVEIAFLDVCTVIRRSGFTIEFGIETRHGAHGRWCELWFQNAQEIEPFLDALLPESRQTSDDLCKHIAGEFVEADDPEKNWEFNTTGHRHFSTPDEPGPYGFHVTTTVSFPATDLPEMLLRLQAAEVVASEHQCVMCAAEESAAGQLELENRIQQLTDLVSESAQLTHTCVSDLMDAVEAHDIALPPDLTTALEGFHRIASLAT